MENPIIDSLAPIFKAEAFHRKGKSWYLDEPRFIGVFNLQKSAFGSQHYLNMGISVKALRDAKFPLVHHCQIYGRVDEVVGDQADLASALNPESPLTLEERQMVLRRIVSGRAIPFVRSLMDLESLRTAVKGSALRSLIVTQHLIEYLHE